MVKTLGFDPTIPSEREQAFNIYVSKELAVEVAPGVYNTWPLICLMTKNITVDEYTACIEEDPSTIKTAAPKTSPKKNYFNEYESYARFLQ